MIFRTSEENHNGHPLKVGEDKEEQTKEFFDKKNSDKKPKKSKNKSVINDTKSKKQYEKLKDIMKNDVKKLQDPVILKEVFGHHVNTRSRDKYNDFIFKTESGPGREKVIKQTNDIDKFYLDKDFVKFDKGFDKLIKEYGVEDYFKEKQILAEAYNDHMKEVIKDKSHKIYRYVHRKEIFDILKTGLIKEIDDGETKPDEGMPNTLSPAYKSWTLDKKHKLVSEFRLETAIGDYDFQVMKATAYPRKEKTLKDGQYIDPDELEQQELRLEIGDGIPIKKDTLLRVPKDFFSNMNKYLKGIYYPEEQILDNIKKSGLTVKVDE